MKKLPPIYIFLDLDGVIADFDAHVIARGKAKTDGKPDYDNLDLEWWSSMPAFDGARDFYNTLKSFGCIKFLTGPVPHVDCFSGKAAWIRKFVPEQGKWILRDLIICNSTDKVLIARPDRILIDDRQSNVKQWREAGGIAIHHTGDFRETLVNVEKAIKELAPAMKASQQPPSLKI